ncbi:MAG: ribonuclease D, partial [Phycisphaerae bacterium]
MTEKRHNPEAISVRSQEEIDTLADLCRSEGRFAFDTEFVMEDRYQPEACLLQIATRKMVYLIDPFLDLDLSSIWSLIPDPAVEVVVHAGQEDLALAVQHTGRAPSNIFDVQVVAGFVGYDYPISLQKLVQATKHIRLHKSKTLTDWRKRPLTKAQLRYAAEDVLHLLDVYRILNKKLDKLSRVEWAREELQRFENVELYKRADDDRLFRVKGTGAMEARQLAVVRDILTWRDGLGKKYNRPVRIVLKDHLIA